MLTRADAPGVNHVAHENAAVANLTCMGYCQDHLHRGFYKLITAYNGQCHTLYHIG